MIAALYARYSSDNQREESIVAQLRAGREYCKRKGYTIIHEYADEATTGTNDNRPGFKKMMSDAAKGMFEILISHKIDRIGRNEYEYYTNKFKLNGWGVRIEFAAQQIDTSTPEGALMENQLAGIAAYYSRNLSKEVKKGLRENVLAGKLTGGKPAFGYNSDPKTKEYTIDAHEAFAIRYIFNAYLQDTGTIQICDWLNSHGYKTRRGRDFGKNSIHDILVNRRYIGTCILGKNVKGFDGKRNSHRADPPDMVIVEDACPAIISKEIFKKVAAKMQKNKHRPGSHSARHTYLLSGLVECADCGGMMSGSVTRNRKGIENRYYRCCKKMNHGAKTCQNRAVPACDLENLVLAEIDTLFLNKAIMADLAARVQKKYQEQNSQKGSQLQALKKEYAAAERRMENIYSILENSGLDEFNLQRLSAAKKDIVTLKANIQALEKESLPYLTAEQIEHYIQKYRNDAKSGNATRLRSLLNTFIEKILVTPDTITVRYKFGVSWCDWSDSNTRPTA